MVPDTLSQLLVESDLPEEIRATIRRMVERSDLSPDRALEVGRELVDHFEDGLARGQGARELLEDFGDPVQAGMMIRRWGRGRTPVDPARSRGTFGRWLIDIGTDAKLALRSLRRRPGFAAVAVGILALGIGATTSIFGVVHGILLDPLPYPQSHRLVNVWQTNPDWQDSPVPFLKSMADYFPASWPILEDWDDGLTSLSAVGGYSNGDITVSGGVAVEMVAGHYVTAGVFEALQVAPQLGRFITRADDVAGGPPVAVLSHRLWRRQFAERPDIVGETVTLDGAPVTVIGVMPPGFAFPDNEGLLWLPFEDADRQRDRTSQFIRTVGRLADGAELPQLQAELDVIAAAQAQEIDSEFGARAASRLEEMVGSVQPAIVLLMMTVAVVLLIACVNLANLLLVRGTERRAEFAVRSALGANPATLRRQLMVEGAILGVVGGLVGLGLAAVALDPLRQLIPNSIPRTENIGLSWPVLAVSLIAGVVTALVASVLPTLRLGHNDLAQWMREGARGSGGKERHRLRSVLVVTQVAAAFVLVAGAGVLVRSFAELIDIDPGFRTEQLLIVSIDAPEFRYPEAQDLAGFHRAMRGELEQTPGVRSVGSASNLPFVGGRSARSGDIVTPEEVADVRMLLHIVGGDFFETMGIPLLAGRVLDDRDGPNATRTLVINETGQRQFWPNGSALGQRVRMRRTEYTVVGVVADVSPGSLTEAIQPTVYLSHVQAEGRGRRQSYALRGTSTEVLMAAVRSAVQEVDPMVPIGQVALMEELVARSVEQPRFRTVLVASLAALAAGLALVGIYGVVTYTVLQRTKEIGIRMALGAEAPSILRRVLSGVLLLVAAGLVIGAVVVGLTFTYLDQFLYEVLPYDPTALALAAVAMVLVAVGAGWLPALRASRVDPMTVLRQD